MNKLKADKDSSICFVLRKECIVKINTEIENNKIIIIKNKNKSDKSQKCLSQTLVNITKESRGNGFCFGFVFRHIEQARKLRCSS